MAQACLPSYFLHSMDPPATLVSSRFSTRHCLQQQKASREPLSSQFLGQKEFLQRKCQHILFSSRGRLRKNSLGFATTAAAYAAPGAAAPLQGRYQRVGECLVFPSFPRSREPKAIIKFLGGAFIGASPDLVYSHFIELLAKEGFIIVATPYNVTFDHAVSAQRIHKKFNDTLSILYNFGVPSLGLMPDDLSELPVYSVGHSNGALMQVLIGSLCTENPGQLPKANAIVSFSNKSATDAVPFFEQMSPTLMQAGPLLQSSPLTSVAANFAAEAIKAVRNNGIPLPPGVSNDDLRSVEQFFEQIPGVFSQVADGVLEFKPTPAENRETIAVKYAIPNNLLIKFTDDPIDETDLLESSIQLRSESLGGSFKKLILTGTHMTPCAQDPKWEVGSVFTPADAVAQAVRLATLADLRNLAKRTADWFDSLS
ncbi:unnamed protein product [Calypogeia fissa]